MSLISVPAIMYALSQLEIYESFAAQIGKWVPLTPTPEPGNLEAFARNNLTVIAYPTVYILQLLEWTGVTPGSRAILNSALVVGWLLGFFGLWLASVLVNLSVVLLSQNVSSMLSRFFNRIAHSQIRTISLGGDALGEDVIGADNAPKWVGSHRKPLPADLAADISQLSDTAAAEAIKKIRTQIAALVLAGDGNTLNFLTWRELVHTSYFYVPRFRKLVAYIVTQSSGFRATKEFTQDPDYDIVANWYSLLISSNPGA